MQCPKCDTTLSEQAKFCTHCGTPQARETSASTTHPDSDTSRARSTRNAEDGALRISLNRRTLIVAMAIVSVSLILVVALRWSAGGEAHQVEIVADLGTANAPDPSDAAMGESMASQMITEFRKHPRGNTICQFYMKKGNTMVHFYRVEWVESRKRELLDNRDLQERLPAILVTVARERFAQMTGDPRFRPK